VCVRFWVVCLLSRVFVIFRLASKIERGKE
jgi:hypothetical protein